MEEGRLSFQNTASPGSRGDQVRDKRMQFQERLYSYVPTMNPVITRSASESLHAAKLTGFIDQNRDLL